MDVPVLLLLLYLFNNTDNTSAQSSISNINNYLSNLKIDSQYTEEKIHIAKKISPLLPGEYSISFNKSILVAEKVTKTMDLIDFINSDTVPQINSLELDPKERLQKIVATVQDEIKSSKIENLGLVLDLIINMDKYKKVLSTFISLMKNKNPLSDGNSIMKIVDTLIENSSEKDKDKFKEMTKMLDILKILDSPKSNNPNE